MQNRDFRTSITSLYVSQTSPMVFYIQNSVFSTRIASLYWSQPSSVVLCIHNSDIMARFKSLYGSQTSPVVLSMQYSVISPRITSLQGSQTSPVVLCMQNNVISMRITSLYGSQPSFVAFVCKTATLGRELQVSMGPSPYLRFLHAKQRLLDQNYKSLWVPDFACSDFWMQNSVLRSRMTLTYWSQLSSVVLCMQNSNFSLGTLVSNGPSPHLWFLHAKQRLLDQNCKSL